MAKSKMSVYVKPREQDAVKPREQDGLEGKNRAAQPQNKTAQPQAEKSKAVQPQAEKNKMATQKAKQVILSHILGSRPPGHPRPREDVDDESTKELEGNENLNEEMAAQEAPPTAPLPMPDSPPQMPEMRMENDSSFRPAPSEMQSSALDPLRMLEAALFMSSQSLQAADLGKLVGIAAVGHVNRLLAELGKQYDASGSALEVVEENPGKWAMRIRASFAPAVRRFAGEAEIPKHALRTLAYVSRHEGITKRELFRRLGSTIYEDAAELIDKGFVSAKPAGRTMSLSTTPKFKQYFHE